MRLVKLSINGLFGHFNHVIPFKNDDVTIITAPNGYGKTIALKIIDAIFNKRNVFLSNLQFNSISLVTDKDTLIIKKQDLDSLKFEANLISRGEGEEPYVFSYDKHSRRAMRSPSSLIENYLPFFKRIAPDRWIDTRTSAVFTRDEIFETHSEILSDFLAPGKFPDWYNIFINELDVYFIQDQRLILRESKSDFKNSSEFTDAIEEFANDLSKRIKQAAFQSSKTSQELDSSFPSRLLNYRYNNDSQGMNLDELKERLSELSAKREKLANFGFFSSTNKYLATIETFPKIEDDDIKVLTLYLDDTTKKLQAYDELSAKIDVFSSILNKKRLSFKKIVIDAECGFKFKTMAERDLKLTQLSSGEQHQIVLLYELIFKSRNDLLVLIDEPEISLHVAWQKEFLNDLQDIIKLQDMSVIIATHSPQIINENWDLVVDLEEGAFA
ncbi:AAA family ATPase [Pectobacterium versatile]|uniref:AAA family ATPase n=1 Tax=Pectobacterium versatile TaxID=2488639 RepID=UPI001B395BA4|nr:AAA family ATPase [Pectobacterium versatile]MBQ4775293.1 AAA family ATPase [Pectobacterium versatile]